jgi:hypothetical protein
MLLMKSDQHLASKVVDEALIHIRPLNKPLEIASLQVLKARSEAYIGGSDHCEKAEALFKEAASTCPYYVPANYWPSKLFYEPQGRWKDASDGYARALRIIDAGKCSQHDKEIRDEIVSALGRMKRHALNV